MDMTLPESLARAEQAMALGDMVQAGAALDHALALDPDHREALFKSAEAAFALGDIGKALARFTRLCDLNPNSPEIHHDLAMMLVRADRPEAACAQLRKAAGLAPERLLIRLHLGMCLQQMAQPLPACGEFLHAERLAQAEPPPMQLEIPMVRQALANARSLLRRERARVFATALAPSRDRHGRTALQHVERSIEAYLDAHGPQGDRVLAQLRDELHDRRLTPAEHDALTAALRAIDDFHAQAADAAAAGDAREAA